jgi:polyferredoxin
MRRVRYTVLFLLLMALWLGVGTAVLDYEPFTAFLVSTALPGVLVLAGAFVLLGIFIPRPWCHLLCPVGTLLDLAEDCGRRREKGGTASPSSSQATTQKG